MKLSCQNCYFNSFELIKLRQKQNITFFVQCNSIFEHMHVYLCTHSVTVLHYNIYTGISSDYFFGYLWKPYLKADTF